MLHPQLLNSLFKTFPYKCEDFEYILENTNNIKELCMTFELIVNSIFGLETGLNLSQNDKCLLQWPLKTINKYNTVEYNSIYRFLSTDSLFWSILFKLSNLQVNFKYSINHLPSYISHRIENGLSMLASRADTVSYLNLNALEYYLVSFTSSLLANDTTKAQSLRSNSIYNEFSGKMDLNCIYSDLLENYLNFFLPINTRDVNFPQLINFPQTSLSDSQKLLHQQQNQFTSSPQYSYQAPQRLLKANYFDQTELFVKQEDSTLEQINSNLFNKKLDRTHDLQKIDFFLKLLIDLWICPFSDNSSEKYLNTQLLAQHDVIYEIRQIIMHIYSFSNANYYMNSSNAGMDIQSMSIHEHKDSISYDLNRSRELGRGVLDANNNKNGSYLNCSNSSHQQQARNTFKSFKTPIDDLRIKIVDSYLKRPIYNFFKYNIENWSFSPSIKLLIETWLLYIQPWCSPKSQEEMQYENFMFNIPPSDSIWSEFIRDNLFIYVDLYQLILRRLCLLDLTAISNVQLLYRICSLFSQSYLIDTISQVENNILNASKRRLNSPTRHGITSSSLIKHHNNDKQQQQSSHILNLFKEFNKQVASYKQIFGADSRKVSKKLTDILMDTKRMFLIDTEKKLENKNKNIIYKIFNSLFSVENEQNYRLSHLNSKEIDALMKLVDKCLGFFNSIYQFNIQDDSSSTLNDTATATINHYSNVVSASSTQDYESLSAYEESNDGLTLKLSPRGREKMLNAVCKTSIEKVYDPDTAPIGEFELRPLVYFLRFITDFINYKYQEKLRRLYDNNSSLISSVSRNLLYGPLYYKNKINLQQINSPSKLEVHRRVRLSLRKLADYRLIFYFLITFFFVKFIFGFSFINNFAVFFLLFTCYVLVKALFV